MAVEEFLKAWRSWLEKRTRKELLSWSLWFLFNLPVTAIVALFNSMSFGSFLLLWIYLCFAGFFGTLLVQNIVQRFRKTHKSKADPELRRQREIDKLFQSILEDGRQGDGWSDEQLLDWFSRIKFTMHGLREKEIVDEFSSLFNPTTMPGPGLPTLIPPDDSEKLRRGCLSWLEGMRLTLLSNKPR